MSELNLKEKIIVVVTCLLVIVGIIIGGIMYFVIQPKIDACRIKKIQENLGQNIVITLEK